MLRGAGVEARGRQFGPAGWWSRQLGPPVWAGGGHLHNSQHQIRKKVFSP